MSHDTNLVPPVEAEGLSKFSHDLQVLWLTRPTNTEVEEDEEEELGCHWHQIGVTLQYHRIAAPHARCRCNRRPLGTLC